MARSRKEFVEFAVKRKEYNSRKSRYNSALRLSYTNFITDIFDMKPGDIFSFGDFNAIFPESEKIGPVAEYERPEFPFAIYNPTEYYGAKLDNIGYDEIKSGYGKPMATIYELETGGGIVNNPGKSGKNYKNFGIMGVIQMTDKHKEVEGNYNKAVTATNTKLDASLAANKEVADKEKEIKDLEEGTDPDKTAKVNVKK